MSEGTPVLTETGPLCPYCKSPAAAQALVSAGGTCPECGGSFRVAAPPDAATVEEVRTLGRFQLLQCVGQGSFGAVWRARDTELDRFVALKIPHANLLDSSNLRERFRREARAVAQLRHPGIAPVHEVLDIDGQPVLVSDYVEGVSLKELLERRRLTFRESAALVAEAAEALDYAHSRRLVHRDIKPANILVELTPPGKQPGRVGRAVVVDFGLALREEAEVVLTIDGQVIGTPAYMSPEQASGGGHRADRRSDVYSLGVVLYHLLCGEPPFRGSRAMVLHQVLHEPPRAPRRLNDRIPRDLETICLKAMAKEPGWRYPTAGELAADLRRYLSGEPVHARPQGPVLRLWLWGRRNRALAAVTALAAAALACLVILSLAFALREHHNARELAAALDVSNAHLRKATYRLAESHLNRGLALCEQNQVGPGQLWLARALTSAPPDAGDLDRYLRLSLAAWQSRQCALRACLRHPDKVCTAAFSPDGASCLVLGHDGTCHVWDTRTGTPKAPPGRAGKRVVAAAVGASVVVTGHADGTVQRWALPAFEPLGPPLRIPGRVRSLAVTPDGSTILACGGQGKVTLWRGQGAERAITLSHGGEVHGVAVSPDGTRAFTGGDDRMARVWELGSGKLLLTLPHEDTVGCGAFGQGGALLATGCRDGSVRLWQTASGKPLKFRVRHSQLVKAVAVSPDGKFVLSASMDRRVGLWSVATQEAISSELLHPDFVHAVAIAPDSARVLTAAGQTVRLWSLPASAGAALEVPDPGWVRCIRFSPDDRLLLTAGGEPGRGGACRVWDAASAKLIAAPLAHKDLVLAAAFSPDSRTVAAAGSDGTIRLADAPTGRAGPVLRHAGPVYAVTFNPSGTLLLTAGEDRSARLWDPRSGMLVGKVTDQPAAVMTAAFSPGGEVFFTGDHGGRLCLWRTADLAAVAPCVRTEPILAAAFSHDGTRIVVAAGKQARLFDTSKGAFEGGPLDHGDEVRAVAFSPDDRLVLVAGEDGTAQLWDVRTRKRRGLAFAHTLPIAAAVFSPDGRLVLTGSADGTARLWDVATGRAVGPALRHKGRVLSAAFSRDGRHFATGSSGGTAWLWKTPVPCEGEPREVVRRTEILTGMALDDNERLSVLDATAWQQRTGRHGQAGNAAAP